MDESDFHCVTGWSKLDMKWLGVRFADLAELAQVSDKATHVVCHGYDGYTTKISGAREADKHDAVQVDFAQALEQRRVTLTGSLIYAAVPPGAAPPAAWSLLGWSSADDRPVALPADRGQVVLACGVPGSGKSQAALTQIEAALRPRPCLTAQRMLPTAVASFHTDLSVLTLPDLL